MAALLPHTFLYLSILSFLCLSFPPRYLFFSLLPLTRQLLPSRLLRFCFPSHLCHRSLLQLVPQSHLSDTEMMGKNNKKIKQSEENQSYSRLSLFWRLTPACSLFFFFFLTRRVSGVHVLSVSGRGADTEGRVRRLTASVTPPLARGPLCFTRCRHCRG